MAGAPLPYTLRPDSARFAEPSCSRAVSDALSNELSWLLFAFCRLAWLATAATAAACFYSWNCLRAISGTNEAAVLDLRWVPPTANDLLIVYIFPGPAIVVRFAVWRLGYGYVPAFFVYRSKSLLLFFFLLSGRPALRSATLSGPLFTGIGLKASSK